MEEKDEEIQLKTSGSSTMFTISFEDENENASAIKQKRIIKTANMFTRTHYRTLSLPVANNSFFPKVRKMITLSYISFFISKLEKNICFRMIHATMVVNQKTRSLSLMVNQKITSSVLRNVKVGIYWCF